jgi:hypothetical protein
VEEGELVTLDTCDLSVDTCQLASIKLVTIQYTPARSNEAADATPSPQHPFSTCSWMKYLRVLNFISIIYSCIILANDTSVDVELLMASII